MGFDIRSIFVLKFILLTHSCLNIWTAVYVKFTMRYSEQIVCFWPYFLTMTQHWWPTFKHAKRVTSEMYNLSYKARELHMLMSDDAR